MTDRASLVIDRSRRAPPRRQRPLPIEPSIDYANALTEITNAIAELQELDQHMTKIDQDITQIETRIAEGDQWDAIDLEPRRDELLEQRNHLSHSVLYAANRVTHVGAWLIGEWRENDLDNIARQLSQTDGLFARVAEEWPGVPERPEWQRVYAEAVPF